MLLERESNNSLNSANAIGRISTKTKMMRGSIGGRASNLRFDTQDWYRFTFSGRRSSVGISLVQSGNGKLELLRASGSGSTQIARGVTFRRSAKYISTLLNPGTYYLRVTPEPTVSKRNYRLYVGTGNSTDEVGNSFASAKSIAVSGLLSSWKGQVGIADQVDGYRFTLDTRSNLNLSLPRLGSRLGAVLYQQNGSNAPIQIGLHVPGSGDLLPKRLEAGTYYLEVIPDRSLMSDTINYMLGLTTTANPRSLSMTVVF